MRYENWQKVLYMLLVCAINGCIESALHWYKLYSETLLEKCFELNPYDKCVSNKMVNGKRYFLVKYLDKNKLTHMEAKLLEDLIKNLKTYFGKLLVNRGKQHTYWSIYH